MIALGSPVVIDSDGRTRLVQNISAGEYIHAPLSGRLCRVKFIQRYSISGNLDSLWGGMYKPIVIPAGAIKSFLPRTNVVVSSNQKILVATRNGKYRYLDCDWVLASNLPQHGISTEEYPYPYIEYAEVALSEGVMIDIAGIICMALSAEGVRVKEDRSDI